MAKAIMLQGTGSDVGKSLIVAGLARAFTRRGLRVRPFKPQNMSNNAAATDDGGEIGRAQALQALAARTPATTDMNPVLLKPQSDTGAQVILQGKVAGTLGAASFGATRKNLLPHVLESFHRLAENCDLVIVEGAGSPAETNLRDGDIANMGFACAADVPVVLIGDIDRGGVIAQLVGTHCVLSEGDLGQVKGFLINKFRGNVDLFSDGFKDIADRTRWIGLGVLPWFPDAGKLPAEDAQGLATTAQAKSGFKIAIPHLPRIANFDDLDPLTMEPDVQVDIIPRGTPLPCDADVILLVGSKATLADLNDLRQEGWDVDIAAHLRRGGHVMGLCGGYQMLGKTISDPDGIEGVAGTYDGLGHLDVETKLESVKNVGRREGIDIASGLHVSGYEIHMGSTDGPDCERGWLDIGSGTHGAASKDGRVTGCYLHGLFGSDEFRTMWLRRFGTVSRLNYAQTVETTLDALADHMEAHLELDALLSLAEPVKDG